MDEPTARQEVSFYLKFNSHERIIRTFGLVKNNLQRTLLVQERTLLGNLQKLLRSQQFQPTQSVLVHIFTQIIQAIIHLIQNKVIYGDLCCENILVFQMNPLKPKENSVKLTNFHLAHYTDPPLNNEKQLAIPVRYCAPEILENNIQSRCSELSDVYSMGVLMWEACSKGDIPFGSDKNDDEVRQCRLNGEKLSKPTECDTSLWGVIEDCFRKTPELRYKFLDLQTLFSKRCTL